MVQVCNCCILWNAFYYVLEPGLFLSVQKPDTQQCYFVNWLRCRNLLVYRLSSADFDAPPIPNSAWRTLLGGSLDDLFQMPSSSVETLTKAAHHQLDIQKLLGHCRQEIPMGSEYAVSDVTWRGQTYDPGFFLPDDVKRDVLYDLYETGFYFDLVSLEDSANCSNMDPHLRMELVQSCFPPHFGPQIPAELRFANCGLLAPLIQHHLPYLLAMRTLVMGWHASPRRPLPLEMQISKPSEQYTESEAVRLEKAITEYITQAFWDYFGHAMIVPHYR